MAKWLKLRSKFAEIAVAELSVNLRCPALVIMTSKANIGIFNFQDPDPDSDYNFLIC